MLGTCAVEDVSTDSAEEDIDAAPSVLDSLEDVVPSV